jgi:hypothetical protein
VTMDETVLQFEANQDYHEAPQKKKQNRDIWHPQYQILR